LPPAGFQRDVVARHAPVQASGGDRSFVGRSASTANVHVLESRGSVTRGSSSAGRRIAGHEVGDARGEPPSMSGTENASTGAARSMTTDRDALPSSRFAHGQPRGRLERHGDDASPRAGEGYITGAGQRRETYRGPSTLPQAPQMQRATPIQPESAKAGRDRSATMPGRENMQPRSASIDRQNDAMRMPERPAYQPARAEPMRQGYQPRYEPSRPAQEFRSQPRQESHEQRSAPSHESRSESRSSGGRDAHQH
jgi:hypothetical protein